MNRTIRDQVNDLMETIYNETSIEDYKPTRDRVLIYPLIEKKADTALWVPDDDKPKKALVLAVGPGMMTKKGRIPPDVQKGDIIVMGAWVGELLEENREVYRLVRAGDIMAVLHEHQA